MFYVETFYKSSFSEDQDEDRIFNNYDLRLRFCLEKYIIGQVVRQYGDEYEARLETVRFPHRQVLTVQLFKNNEAQLLSSTQIDMIKSWLKAFELYKNKTLILDIKLYAKTTMKDYYWLTTILPLLDDNDDFYIWNDQLYVVLGEDYEYEYFFHINRLNMMIEELYNLGVWKVFSDDVVEKWELEAFDDYYMLPFELSRTTLTRYEAMKQIVSNKGLVHMFVKVDDNFVTKHYISAYLHSMGITPIFSNSLLLISLDNMASYRNLVSLLDNIESQANGEVELEQLEELPKEIDTIWYKTLTYEKPITLSRLFRVRETVKQSTMKQLDAV